jgi:hypothetical protein
MGLNQHPNALNAATLNGAALLSDSTAAPDSVSTYFECITECSIDDGDCVTRCVEVLREQH